MKKNIFNFVIPLMLLFLVNCSDSIDKELHNLVKKKYIKWAQTEDTTYLEQAYKQIKSSKEFREKGITKKNVSVFEPIFFNLKKYKELDSLLSNMKMTNKNLPLKLEGNSLIVKYFMYKQNNDTVKLNHTIHEIVNFELNAIKKDPKDTLLYIEYFLFKSKIYPEKVILKEIDSIKEKGIISKDLYNYISQNIKNNPY